MHPLSVVLQGISDNVPLVKAVVPKTQSHSFITQGSPDTMVSLGPFLLPCEKETDVFLVLIFTNIVRAPYNPLRFMCALDSKICHGYRHFELTAGSAEHSSGH